MADKPKIIRPPWYDALEDWLEPMQGVTIGILVAVILVCLFMIFQKSASLRTLWAVYLVSP